MSPIKIGIIGFGRMGGFYLEQMRKSGDWEVAYICDVCEQSREEARKLAPEAKVIADEQIIFDDPEVAVVGLFALADSRLSQIGKAFAAGKHVIAEKPIADSVEREWEAVGLAERTPVFSTVNLYLRNSWYHNTIKEFVASGEIGELAIIRVCHMTPGLRLAKATNTKGLRSTTAECTMWTSRAGMRSPNSRPGMRRPYACGTTRIRGGCSATAPSRTAWCSTSRRGMSTGSSLKNRPITPMWTSSARRASRA